MHAIFRFTARLMLPLILCPLAMAESPPPRMEQENIEPIPLEVGPETTVVEGPLRENGTVDYAAALNAMLSEGVTPESNVYVVVATLTAPDDWPDDDRYRPRVFELLGVPMPGDDAIYFTSIETFAEQRAADDPRWHEVVMPEADGEDQPPWQAEPTETPRWMMEHDLALEGPWSAEDVPLVTEWLAQQRPALDRLAEGVRRDRYWMPLVLEDEDELVVSALMPSLGQMRKMLRTLKVRALHRLHEGDVDGAIADLLTIKRLGHAMQEDLTLIGQLVGMSITAESRDIMPHLVSHPDLTPAQARRANAELAALSSRFPIHQSIDRMERFFFLDVAQRLFHADGEALIKEFVPEPNNLPINPHMMTVYFDRNRAMRRANAFYDRLVEAMTADTRPERQAKLAEIEAEIAAESEQIHANGERLDVAGMVHRLAQLDDDAQRRAEFTDSVLHLLLALLTPGFSSVSNTADVVFMFEQVERVALAVAGHHAADGEYPESLEALVPDWLDAVPEDLLDAEGGPVRYRVEAERIVVYSVGRNGEDDAGLDDVSDGDLVIAWPRSD
ncbi:MAG: hypothetical protein WD151_13435 [Phycisphaeraceae bacterium]